MKILPKSVNRWSFFFANLSSKEKHPSTMKLLDQCITMIIDNINIQSMSTASTLMTVGLWKIEKKIQTTSARKKREFF
jgi:hypothetical protein